MKQLKDYQVPLSIDDQITNLIHIGMKINDIEYAKYILERVSYYRLIKAYSLTLKDNGFYKVGTTFEDVVNIYNFDKDLRYLLFSIIEQIEIKFRSNMANYFSLQYGNFGYRDLDNFKNKDLQIHVLENIDAEIKRNERSPFIKNFMNNYIEGKVPFYAAVEVTTFGCLSKFYKNMKNIDKKAIAKNFGLNYSYFESWIENYAYIRNICAHYGRLYNAKLTKKPILYKEFTSKGVKNDSIFASILNCKYVIDEDEYKEFIKQLKLLLNKYKGIDIKCLGFPEKWENLV